MKGNITIFRVAFLVALVVGLGHLFHVYPPSATLTDVHVVAGLIMLVALIWIAVETKNAVVVIAAILVIASGILPFTATAAPWLMAGFHIGLMVVAVILVEVAVSRTTHRARVH